MSDFGVFLKNKRLEKKYSQSKIAKRLKFTSPQFISNLERGISFIPANRIKLMANVLGVDPRILIDRQVAAYKLELLEKSGI